MAELEGRSLSIFVVTIVFLALSFISVCLRCFVRLRLVRAFGWDDALMVFAMVCCCDPPDFMVSLLITCCSCFQALNILFALCGITGACYGLGHKLLELTEHEKKTAMFVCFLPRTWFSLPLRSRCLTGSTVVVAWPDNLCFHLCRRQNLHRIGPSPSHRRKGAHYPPMDRHRSINRGWPRVLVCVDVAVPSRRLFLEASGA